MPEVIKVYRQRIPAARFVGKIYGDGDRGADGGFGAQWDEWWREGWFERLRAAVGGRREFEDADATIGLMRWKDGEPFQYWIGMFLPAGTEVPEGFRHVDFDATLLGVGWLRGTEAELFGHEDMCAKACMDAGQRITDDGTGAYWFFERYCCPRFTVPDADGRAILDICHFIAE